MGIHDRKSQTSDRIVPKRTDISAKLRHYRLYFLPTRDSYVGPGRGHQQWSSPHKRAEYNLEYLIIAFCILILTMNINCESGGYKESTGNFMKSSKCFDPEYHLLVV